MSKYDKIMNYPHPVSKKHKPMSLYNRAAQFAPFAALTGYEDVISETGRMTDERIELNDDQISDVNSSLLYLIENKDTEAVFTIFVKDSKKSGGSYLEIKGTIKKLDLDNRKIILNNSKTIVIDDLISISF